ncbi:MAG: O-methyltransferase [Phycisphaerae bacterium]
MSSGTLQLDKDLGYYVSETMTRESDVLRRLRQQTQQMERAEMQISPEQGQFMSLLARVMNVRRAIEVGTFTGYSALCIAAAMPEDGTLIACDIHEEWTAIARRYWQEAGLASRIQLHLRPALHTLHELIREGGAGTFDFAFIDADKENYQNYYEATLTLLRPGGVVAVDNALWSGRVVQADQTDVDTRAIRNLNEHVRNDRRVQMSLVPIGDGLLLARKE